MSISERLRQLRKELGMSQEEFGRRIGVSNTAISKLEKNERNLTEQTAKSICREYRVNYFWLTEGTGEPFTGTPESIIDEIAEDYNLDDIDKKIIERYLELSDKERQVIKEYIKSILA
nr:MAG TPA: Helix-turn-helix XRE-family like protein [Caudoviricetes sp.]